MTPTPLPAQIDDEDEAPAPPLLDEIAATLRATVRWPSGSDLADIEPVIDQAAASIVHLLNERGHYLPGCPPAAQILKDAEQFAGQFMLAILCVRLLRAMNGPIWTAERTAIERWLFDYIDGKNHGPVGKPMFWPQNLPGLCQQLREWGYAPTATRPPFVARAIKSPTLQ